MNRKTATQKKMCTRLMDVTVALLCLPLAIGVIGSLYILYAIFNRDDDGFIYKGERFGKNKKVFNIYKIRTLKKGAEQQIASDVLKPGDDLELPFGRFLRRTRLDELPQIYNIIRGDLSLIGPRPVRPLIYEKYLKIIPNYDIRFNIKPGLIGYSQLVTPHNAPKKVRAVLNNYYIKKRKGVINDFSLLVFATVYILNNLYRESILTIKDNLFRYKFRGFSPERRKMRRVRNKDLHFYLADEFFENYSTNGFKVKDLNQEAIVVTTDLVLNTDRSLQFFLKTNGAKSHKLHQAKCSASHFTKKVNVSSNSNDGKWRYVIFYQPVTDMNHYIIGKYILKESIL